MSRSVELSDYGRVLLARLWAQVFWVQVPGDKTKGVMSPSSTSIVGFILDEVIASSGLCDRLGMMANDGEGHPILNIDSEFGASWVMSMYVACDRMYGESVGELKFSVGAERRTTVHMRRNSADAWREIYSDDANNMKATG